MSKRKQINLEVIERGLKDSDCDVRAAECHTHCKTYLDAREENKKRYAKNAQNRVFSDITTAAVNDRMKKMHRKQKQI